MFAVPALALARRRSAVVGVVVFSGVVTLFVVPALLLGGGEFLRELLVPRTAGFAGRERGCRRALILTGNVTGFDFDFGAFEARGPGTELAATLSLPVTGILLLATLLLIYRAHLAERLGAAAFPRYAAALILAFMLGSKVLSPQYMVWLLPLVPLALPGYRGVMACGLFAVSCWATTQVFPTHYDELLVLQAPGPGFLVFRNVTLVALWIVLLAVPAIRRKDAG